MNAILSSITQTRIDRVCSQIVSIYSSPDNDNEELIEILRLMLKEQDRDTRHACAEAVIQISDPFDIRKYPTIGDRCKSRGFVTAINAAHAACMNARAI